MWMTLAPGANISSLPVTRSSKREPQAISRSARFIAQLAALEPCMPGSPMHSGWQSGKTPLAISVVTTGICTVSATRISWAGSTSALTRAAAHVEDRPLAARIASAAVMICLGCPCRDGL